MKVQSGDRISWEAAGAQSQTLSPFLPGSGCSLSLYTPAVLLSLHKLASPLPAHHLPCSLPNMAVSALPQANDLPTQLRQLMGSVTVSQLRFPGERTDWPRWSLLNIPALPRLTNGFHFLKLSFLASRTELESSFLRPLTIPLPPLPLFILC